MSKTLWALRKQAAIYTEDGPPFRRLSYPAVLALAEAVAKETAEGIADRVRVSIGRTLLMLMLAAGSVGAAIGFFIGRHLL